MSETGIFDALYEGRINFEARPLSAASRAKQAQYAPLMARLEAQLDRETIDQLFTMEDELTDLSLRDAYAAGIRLGGRFMLELLTGDLTPA